MKDDLKADGEFIVEGVHSKNKHSQFYHKNEYIGTNDLSYYREKLYKTNMLYSVFRKVNHVIIRTKDIERLYDEVCKIAVGQGLFNFACIGIRDNGSGELKCVGQFSNNEKEAELIHSAVKDSSSGARIIEDVMSSGECFSFNISIQGCFLENGSAEVRKYVCTLVPLKTDNKVFGLMNFCSAEDSFDEEEVELLKALSEDISFAIKSMEEEKLRKQAEENIRLLNEEIEYDKLRTEFFANISHELRTPINVILSAVQLLNIYLEQDIIKDSYTSRINRYMYTIQQNCYRLMRMVNNIIDITKIDAGFLELKLENNDIVSIVEDITLSASEYVESRGISLLFDTEVEEKVIACDSDKIERVILNLLSNSIKFTEVGGKIEVNIFIKKDKLYISVEDNGIGIPKEKGNLVFERFHQVDKSLTRSNEGSGIGLSLVKALVEIQGGVVHLESNYGEGSIFTIELPIRLVNADDGKVNKDTLNDNIEKINIEFSDIY